MRLALSTIGIGITIVLLYNNPWNAAELPAVTNSHDNSESTDAIVIPTPKLSIDISDKVFDELELGMTQPEISKIIGGDPGNYTGQNATYVMTVAGVNESRWALADNRKQVAWITQDRTLVVTFDPDGNASWIKFADTVLKGEEGKTADGIQ